MKRDVMKTSRKRGSNISEESGQNLPESSRPSSCNWTVSSSAASPGPFPGNVAPRRCRLWPGGTSRRTARTGRQRWARRPRQLAGSGASGALAEWGSATWTHRFRLTGESGEWACSDYLRRARLRLCLGVCLSPVVLAPRRPQHGAQRAEGPLGPGAGPRALDGDPGTSAGPGFTERPLQCPAALAPGLVPCGP